ncbi:protocadherin-7-like [Conger conger]|uniref:protocadherin-7-like n=1 Tax=Conger conger TaxID=82655 RepID=UPI002A59A97E|nr:protocadherin-7-like [Conger conger]
MRHRAAAEVLHSCALLLPLLFTQLAAKQVLLYRAAEEGLPDMRIGDVAADLGLALGSEEVTFSLESGSEYLKINNLTGELSTTQRMDRESLAQCERVFEESECFVEFEVCVIGPEQSWVRLWEGRLVVLDVNDHTPSFPSPALSVSVEENQPIGTLYLLPTATDRDFGPNGVQWYELLQGAGRGRGRGRSSVFQLQVADTPEGGKQPQLIVKGDLDRERRDAYDLILRASDGGTPPRTTQASLRISVTDANDNSPRFERAQYEAELDENAAVGVSVLQVRAVDLDVGANGQVQYALAPGPGFQGAGHFLQVEAGSGWISVRQPIDREETAQLRFAITASDRGQPALSATATVLLQVRDLNDNAPTVEIRKIGRFTLRQGVARVPEDVVVDTPVALVQVWDRDAGRNGEVTCTLVGDVPFQLRPAGGAVGGAGGGASGRKFLLHTAAALDHEVATAHRLLVVAVDAGSPALTGSGALTVEVGDVNDHAPVFLRGALEAALRENNAPGETLAKAEALDADSGRNGEVLYSLDPSAHTLFSINPRTGDITANTVLDRERGDRYEFRVWATDRGVPGLQSSAPVRVRVLDMNDNSPAFPHHAFTFYAPENLPEHSSVGTVTATDADAGRNAELSLFISQEEDEEEGMFFISNATGTIFCRRMLDREAQAVHRFGVIAVDGGDPPRSCSTTVTLFVTDENDNPPRVVAPGNASFTLLPPSSPAHSAVTRVVAVDADEGQNAELRFGLVGGNPFGLFSVDPQGGTVALVGGLGPGHGGLHRLVLRVSDRGSPPLHTTTLVHVFVNHTLGNGTWVQEAVARSLALPLSQNVAGDGRPGWVHPQGLSLAIGALAGGVAVLLLIMLVVTVTHCTPGSRKGYRVGRREEGEEGANVAEVR